MSGPGPGEGEIEFETTLTELEDIVARLDRDGVGLDDAVSLFEQGIDRLKRANAWLDRAAGRVEELIVTATGDLETREMSDVSADEDEGGADTPDDPSPDAS